MTITERTADVRRRLDEIEATASRGTWDRRKEHLIRACFAHAAALAGEIGKIDAYVYRGMIWWEKHKHQQGTKAFDMTDAKLCDAIVARSEAQDVLRDALRILTPIEGAEIPATWNPGIDWAEVA
jgi:hypothetical protein